MILLEVWLRSKATKLTVQIADWTRRLQILGLHSIHHKNMEDSHVYLNGQRFLQDGRPLMLGISPGNPFYYKKETLKQLFDFAARKNPEQVR